MVTTTVSVQPLVSYWAAEPCSSQQTETDDLLNGKSYLVVLGDRLRCSDLLFKTSLFVGHSFLYTFSVCVPFFTSLLSLLFHPSTPKHLPLLFFLFLSLSVWREWCLCSHVTFCLNTIAGVCHWPVFFERALVSRVTGNGGTASLFSPAAPSPLHCSEPVSLWRSVSSAGSGGSGSMWARHTQWQDCLALPPSPSFSSGRPS